MKTYSMTNVGRQRETNQDYLFTSENPIGNLPNLFIVADGMGGHNAGDFASKFTVEKIMESASVSKETEIISILRGAIHSANQELLGKAKEEEALQGMGTTVVAAVLDGKKLYVANVGDSRLYIVNEQMTQVTKDHSLVEEMVRLGEMDENVAKVHPDKHIITRAIGAAAELVIDFFEVELQPGDQILMCSDGLTNMLDDTTIRQLMMTQRDLAEEVTKLIDAANENGGTDNITVIVIRPF